MSRRGFTGSTLQGLPRATRSLRRIGWTAITASALCSSLPAQGLYKVVGPDGKVTYTDRAPGPSDGKVTSINAAGNTVAETTALPLELRQVAARYPVVLYAIADCPPCDNARSLLRQRGVPYTEKLVLTEDDAEALKRLTGGRSAPTLMIGQQPLQGLSVESWNAYLDAAGYPRESRLPAGYQFPAATPLTEKRDSARAASAAIAPRAQPEEPPADNAAPAVAAPTGIRF